MAVGEGDFVFLGEACHFVDVDGDGCGVAGVVGFYAEVVEFFDGVSEFCDDGFLWLCAAQDDQGRGGVAQVWMFWQCVLLQFYVRLLAQLNMLIVERDNAVS